MMQDLATEHELTTEMTRVVVEAGLELETLAKRGVLTDECRAFPSDVVLEQASPGYGARRRRLRSLVRKLAVDLFRVGAELLPLLTTLRAICAKAMKEEGVRRAIQQLILAEVSTACVAASYSVATESE